MYKLIQAEQKGYAEITQTKAFRYAFVTIDKDSARELFSPIKCKDFFNEALASRSFGKPYATFGFSFDFSKTPYDVDATKFSLECSKEDFKLLLENLPVIHMIEKHNGLALTTLDETNISNKYICIADKAWQERHDLMSTYTWLLRLMLYKKIDNIENWVDEITPVIPSGSDSIFKSSPFNGRFKSYIMNLFEYKFPDVYVQRIRDLAKANVSIIHNNTGIWNALNFDK